MRHRRILIDQIAIREVLQDEVARIKPVIEDLATQNVPTNSPAQIVSLGRQKVVTQLLYVEVMNLECRMCDMRVQVRLRWLEEERMMVGVVVASIDVKEDLDSLAVSVDDV